MEFLFWPHEHAWLVQRTGWKLQGVRSFKHWERGIWWTPVPASVSLIHLSWGKIMPFLVSQNRLDWNLLSYNGHCVGNALFIDCLPFHPSLSSCLTGVSWSFLTGGSLPRQTAYTWVCVSESSSGESKPSYQVTSFSAHQFHSLKMYPLLCVKHLTLARHFIVYKDCMTLYQMETPRCSCLASVITKKTTLEVYFSFL